MIRDKAQDQREFLAACEGSKMLARELWNNAGSDYHTAMRLLSDHNATEDHKHAERPF